MGSLMSFSAIPFYRVCLNDNSGGNISGEIFCGIAPKGSLFNGIEDLMFQLEKLMDTIKFPQSTMQKRSFKEFAGNRSYSTEFIQESQKTMKKYNADDKFGKLATLIIQVQFRQNASWQGKVKWVEKEEIYSFESELELIKLVDTILNK